MESQKKVRAILAASIDMGAPPAEDPMSAPIGPNPGDEGGKRNIPKEFDYNPKSLKPLARMLLSMSISLGHALTAYKEFTKLKSSNISPDGMIGGRGYVLKVKDVRGRLQQACEMISSVSDTVYDEINAPHWKPRISELGQNEAEDITEFLEESKKIMDDPEGYADDELNEMEEKNDGPDGTSDEEKSTEDPRFTTPAPPMASKMPGGGDPQVQTQKETPQARPKTSSLEDKILSRFREGNSSLPVNTLPGGPRVDHLDRGEQTGPWGSYNTEEPKPTADDWGRDEGVGNQNYLYQSESRLSESAMPSDSTPTDGNDYGLGWGAKGDGLHGLGTIHSDGWGSVGPNSGLPDDPGGKLNGRPGDSTPYIEHNHKNPVGAAPWGMSGLPNDGEEPVARSDYYKDPHLAESGLPGSPQNLTETPLDMSPNEGERERDDAVPYVKWDSTTHNNRHDQQDFYSYDRTSDD